MEKRIYRLISFFLHIATLKDKTKNCSRNALFSLKKNTILARNTIARISPSLFLRK